jgi:hypothetical protein
MSKRYYYTCPIKALYMMKEFGVEFDIKGINNFVAYMKNPVDGARINVATKSQKIFKPRNYDLAGFTRDDGISTIAQYDEAKKAFINGSFRILKKYNPEIIMRDNKQFFMPEVEND